MTKTKPWYLSVTVWFNLALILVGVIQAVAVYVPIPYSFLAMVGSFGNILLRFKTDSSILPQPALQAAQQTTAAPQDQQNTQG